MHESQDKVYLSRLEAAEYLRGLGVSIGVNTLARLAWRNRGPRYRIVCRRAFYTADDLKGWLEARAVETREAA